MAKGQTRSTREIRKPKKEKAPKAAATYLNTTLPATGGKFKKK